MGDDFLGVVAIALLIDAAMGLISYKKGNSFWSGFLISLFLSPVVGLVAVLAQSKDVKTLEWRAMRSGELKRCPACAELIKSAATVCRFCKEKQ